MADSTQRQGQRQGGIATQTAPPVGQRKTSGDLHERSPAPGRGGSTDAKVAAIVTATMRCTMSHGSYEGFRVELEALPGTDDSSGQDTFWAADGSTLPGTVALTGLRSEIGNQFTVGETYAVALWPKEK